MIRRKYANMRIYEDNIDFADVENTITYSLSAKNLENNLNKREEELCNKIADLEVKLSECESELEKQKEKYDKLYGCYKKTSSEDLQDKYSLAEENEQLKKQLAEKEKEIEYQESMKILAVENQNKKAIEQLEQVKETAECVLDNALKNSSLNESYYDRLLDEIDNQINVLRNNKDGIH